MSPLPATESPQTLVRVSDSLSVMSHCVYGSHHMPVNMPPKGWNEGNMGVFRKKGSRASLQTDI